MLLWFAVSITMPFYMMRYFHPIENKRFAVSITFLVCNQRRYHRSTEEFLFPDHRMLGLLPPYTFSVSGTFQYRFIS